MIRKTKKTGPRTEKSFLVPKAEIVENGYDLSINKYKKTEYKPVEYPPTSEIMAELRSWKCRLVRKCASSKSCWGCENGFVGMKR